MHLERAPKTRPIVAADPAPTLGRVFRFRFAAYADRIPYSTGKSTKNSNVLFI